MKTFYDCSTCKHLTIGNTCVCGKMLGYVLDDLPHYKYAKCNRIVFLDVDGVLNCASTKETINGFVGLDESKIELLSKFIKNWEDTYIVLISTWIDDKKMLTHLENRFKKYDLKIHAYIDRKKSRGEAICDYLQNNRLENNFYVIFDDELFDYKKMNLTKHLIQTGYYGNGLTNKHIKKANNMFINFMNKKES